MGWEKYKERAGKDLRTVGCLQDTGTIEYPSVTFCKAETFNRRPGLYSYLGNKSRRGCVHHSVFQGMPKGPSRRERAARPSQAKFYAPQIVCPTSSSLYSGQVRSERPITDNPWTLAPSAVLAPCACQLDCQQRPWVILSWPQIISDDSSLCLPSTPSPLM